MIRYNLACEAGHGFESWFPSGSSYDDQAARGLVTCPVCGSAKVGKGMMAPAIGRGGAGPSGERESSTEAAPDAPSMIAEPERRMRAMLRAVREHVTKNAEDVGGRFPEEARRMHYGEAEPRPIYGEASPIEARALAAEGIDVSPLPPRPDDSN